MKFSVIIPAYNEAEVIGRAIHSLERQSVLRTDFEIIVVDNNSKDDTAVRAKDAGADLVIREAMQGTNVARQAGFKASKGKIVAFLDGDSEASPDWLARIGNDLSRMGIFAVSGPYDYRFKGLIKLIDRLYVWLVLPHAPKILNFFFRKKSGVIIGGNFAAWRDTIEAIGGIPPLKFWGDDTAIAMLISRRVGRVLFDPELKVITSPRRFNKDGLFATNIKYIWAYLKIYFSKDFQ